MAIVRTLLAALFAVLFLSSTADAADYYFETGTGGGACTEADPCATVAAANAITYAPGDSANFNCADTFGDAILNLNQSGSSGSPITVRAGGPDCPGVKPFIGSISLLRNWDVDTDWIACQDVHFTLSSGASNTSGHVAVIGADNFSADGCDVTGASNSSAGGIKGYHFDDAVNATLSNLTITDVNASGISIDGTTTCTFDSLTFGTFGVGGPQGGDAMVSQEGWTGATCVANDPVFDDAGTAGSEAENCFDTKGSGAWTVNRGQWLSCNFGGALLLVQGNTTTTLNDPLIDALNASTGRYIQVGSSSVAGTPRLIVNRGIIVSAGAATTVIQVGATNTEDAELTLNATAVEAPSGSGAQRLIDCRQAATCTATNSSLVGRNGDTMQEVVRANADCTACVVPIKNSILDTDDTNSFVIESDSAGTTWTMDQNLYESDISGNWADINGTTYTEATLISSFDTSGSTTGDPLFVSEDETSDLYLMLETGSPGIGLGDPGNLYATPALDLLGYPFNGTTPNAGARSQRIQIKASNDNAPAPPNDNRPPAVDLGGPWAVAVRCDCEPTALNWPRSFELTCRCAQRM